VVRKFSVKFVLATAANIAVTSGCAPVFAKPIDSHSLQHGWILNQSSTLIGDQTIYVSPIAMRLTTKKTSVMILTIAPDFDVKLFNTRSKKMYECKAKNFVNSFSTSIATASGVVYSEIPLKLKNRDLLNGLKICNYETPDWLAKKAYDGWKTGLSDRGAVTSATYVVSDQFPSAICETIARFYGLPQKGLPLDFKYKNVSKETQQMLRTTSCRSAEISLAEFQAPTGYKRVQTVAEVTKDKNSDDVLELFEGLSESINKQTRPKKK
jgi:hypothetical protein